MSEITEASPTSTRGIPIEHWGALLTFSAESPSGRDHLHGATGRGHDGKPSPFANLARHANGWRHLKHWDLKQDDRAHIVDAVGRIVIPTECFAVFIYASALEAYSKHDQFDGRVRPAAVIEALVLANISAGVPSKESGGRPPIFSIAMVDVITLLGLPNSNPPTAASSNVSCTIDAALENYASARELVAATPQLRRFLSALPSGWPTAANSVAVIDEFKAGLRRSLIFGGLTKDYLRHKVESLASLMGVCMPHTSTCKTRISGARCDVFRCHRRRTRKVLPLVIHIVLLTNISYLSFTIPRSLLPRCRLR